MLIDQVYQLFLASFVNPAETYKCVHKKNNFDNIMKTGRAAVLSGIGLKSCRERWQNTSNCIVMPSSGKWVKCRLEGAFWKRLVSYNNTSLTLKRPWCLAQGHNSIQSLRSSCNVPSWNFFFFFFLSSGLRNVACVFLERKHKQTN